MQVWKILSFLWIVIWMSGALAQEAAMDPKDVKALRELEQQVTDLKERVHESKAQLHAMEEAVLRGKIAGSKALITFENQAEGFFSFASAEFYLDDELVQKVEGKGRKKTLKKLLVYDNNIPAGEHTLTAKIKYEGTNKSIYKMFSYFKDHKFIVKTAERFPVEYGKTTIVKVIALDKGYFKERADERLYLKIQILRDWGTATPE